MGVDLWQGGPWSLGLPSLQQGLSCSLEPWVPGGPAAPEVGAIAITVNIPGASLPEGNSLCLTSISHSFI